MLCDDAWLLGTITQTPAVHSVQIMFIKSAEFRESVPRPGSAQGDVPKPCSAQDEDDFSSFWQVSIWVAFVSMLLRHDLNWVMVHASHYTQVYASPYSEADYRELLVDRGWAA